MQRNFIPLNIVVMTISDIRTEDNNKLGKLLVEHLTVAGHNTSRNDHLLLRVQIQPTNIHLGKMQYIILKPEITSALNGITRDTQLN